MDSDYVISKKVVLVGDGGVGKTTFLSRLRNCEFDPNYVATLGAEVYPIKIDSETNFNVWDTAGQEKFSGLKEGYYILAKGFVLMASLTSQDSMKSLESHYIKIRRVSSDAPIVIVYNKSDCENTKEIVKIKQIEKDPKCRFSGNISSKTGYNINEPFTILEEMMG